MCTLKFELKRVNGSQQQFARWLLCFCAMALVQKKLTRWDKLLYLSRRVGRVASTSKHLCVSVDVWEGSTLSPFLFLFATRTVMHEVQHSNSSR